MDTLSMIETCQYKTIQKNMHGAKKKMMGGFWSNFTYGILSVQRIEIDTESKGLKCSNFSQTDTSLR